MSRKSDHQLLPSKRMDAVISAVTGAFAGNPLLRNSLSTSKFVGIIVWRYARGIKVVVRSDSPEPAPRPPHRFMPVMYKRHSKWRVIIPQIIDASNSRRTVKAARLSEMIDRKAAAWSKENASLIARLKAEIRPGDSSAFRWIDPAAGAVPSIDSDSVAQLLGAKRL